MTKIAAQAILDNPNSVIVSGPKPVSARARVSWTQKAAFVAVAALLGMGGLGASASADATSWQSLMVNSRSTSGNVYARNEARTVQNAHLVTVLSVRPVTIENSSNMNGGTAVGGALGAMMGSQSGRRSGSLNRSVRTLGGGLVGALIGGKVDRVLTRQHGLEYTILENRNGRQIMSVITQDARDSDIRPGDVAMLSGSGRNARLAALDPAAQATLQNMRSQQANLQDLRNGRQQEMQQPSNVPSRYGY